MDIVISKLARGHTLLSVSVADLTHVDLVVRASVVSQHAAAQAARQKERHYSGYGEALLVFRHLRLSYVHSPLDIPLSRDYPSWGSHGDCGVF